MGRVKNLLAGFFFLLLGLAMIFHDRFEVMSTSIPEFSELDTITAQGPFEAEIKTAPTKLKTRYFMLKLPNRERFSVDGVKLDEVAAAISSARELTYSLKSETSKHTRDLWQLVAENNGQGRSETILSYEECVETETRGNLFLELLGIVFAALGIGGTVCGIAGFEDKTRNSNLVAAGAVIAALVFIAIWKGDEVRFMLRGDEPAESTAS